MLRSNQGVGRKRLRLSPLRPRNRALLRRLPCEFRNSRPRDERPSVASDVRQITNYLNAFLQALTEPHLKLVPPSNDDTE
jgi:hypothetical protein